MQFLRRSNSSKNNYLDKNNIGHLFENIRQDNVEEKFGGTAPNIQEGLENKNTLFPPRMPSMNFTIENY